MGIFYLRHPILILLNLSFKVTIVKSYTEWLVPFHNSHCPPYFNETNCNGIISSYDVEADDAYVESCKKVHDFEGLNTILKTFQESHPLVILTDFHNTWFPQIDFPVFLRSLRLVLFYGSGDLPEEWDLRGIVYVQNSILHREAGLADIVLPASPYFASWEILPFLNISEYSRNTRPWNNIVSIALFPHIRLRNIRNNPVLFVDRVITHKYNFANIFPATVPDTKILINHPLESNNVWDISNIIISSIRSEIRRDYIVQEQLYLLSTVFANPGPVESVMSISIENFQQIQICRRKFQIQLNFISSSIRKVHHLAELTKPISTALCHGNPNLNNLVVTFRPTTNDMVDPALSIKKSLHICNRPLETKEKGVSPEISRASEEYANVWLSVMGNFSYGARNHLCFEGRRITIVNDNSRNHPDIEINVARTFVKPEASGILYPAVLASLHDDLKLIISGFQGLEELQSKELLHVFDEFIWFLIILFSFAITLIFSQIPSFASSLSTKDSVLIPVKLLLEQGNPFPESLMTTSRCSSIIGTLLCMGIVLSNAYKNTNVYNMIIPRTPVAYQNLEELVHDKFPIYTRSLEVGGFHLLPTWPEKSISNFSLIHLIFGLSRKHIQATSLSSEGQSDIYTFQKSEVQFFRKESSKVKL